MSKLGLLPPLPLSPLQPPLGLRQLQLLLLLLLVSPLKRHDLQLRRLQKQHQRHLSIVTIL